MDGGVSDVFLQQGGILGAVVLVQFLAIAYIFKTLLACNTARVDDLVKTRDTTEAHTAAIKELSHALENLVDQINRRDQTDFGKRR